MRRPRIGTSGYVYRHWRGRFYPRALPAGQWLAWYAARFDAVELNAPFYRLPTPEACARWRAQVPPGFVFAVKASRFMTHVKRLVEPVFARLRDAGIALCLADWRDAPVAGPITADLVYVRRHGWPSRGGRPYPPAAVARDAAAVRGWAARGLDVHVYYNNDDRAFAVANALALRALVQRRRPSRRPVSQATTSTASATASSRYTRAIRPRVA